MNLYSVFNPRKAFSLVDAFDLDEAGDVASLWVENDEFGDAFWRMHMDIQDDASSWGPEDVDRHSALAAVRRLRKIADKLESIASAGAMQPALPGVAFGKNLSDPNEPAWINGEWRMGPETVLVPPEQETITIRLVLRMKPRGLPNIILDKYEVEDE